MDCDSVDFRGMNCDLSTQTHCPAELSTCSREMIWSGCYACKTTDPTSACIKSNAGYYLDKSACVQCTGDMCCPEGSTYKSITACTNCTADKRECLQCVKKYQLVDKVCRSKASSSTSLTLGLVAVFAAVIAALI